jgi:hypothetical protein
LQVLLGVSPSGILKSFQGNFIPELRCLPDQTFAFLFDFWIGVSAPHIIDSYFPCFCFILSLLYFPENALMYGFVLSVMSMSSFLEYFM